MNMSYCRFENTYADLRDCYNNIQDDDLSETEQKYRQRLIELCQTIAEEAGEEQDRRHQAFNKAFNQEFNAYEFED